MNVSKVHHCISQEMVAQGLEEPPAKKCTCRKIIAYKKADEMVKKGEARWTVVGRERGTREEICSLCGGDSEVKNCASCRGTGKRTVAAVWDTYNYDIVLVSQAAHDPKEKKYRPALALKTPRVATIESKHIVRAYVDEKRANSGFERVILHVDPQIRRVEMTFGDEEHIKQAYVSGDKSAQIRIEQYGMLILKEQIRQLATGLTKEQFDEAWREYEERDFHSPAFSFRLEPEDNEEKHEGRGYDFGRAI